MTNLQKIVAQIEYLTQERKAEDGLWNCGREQSPISLQTQCAKQPLNL